MSSAPPLAYSTKTSKYRSVVEDAGVEQLVLELLAGPPAVGLHQVGVRKGRLRVLVEVLHVRVRRRAVEVEVVLLHVLAVVPLAVGQPEEPLLEDRVLPVPQGQREAEALLVVGDAGQPVLAPAVGARPGLVVREEVPRIAVLAVVLADRAPLPLAQVGAPRLPADLLLTRVIESDVFCGLHGCLPVTAGRVTSGNESVRHRPPRCWWRRDQSMPLSSSCARLSPFDIAILRFKRKMLSVYARRPPPGRVYCAK